MLYLTGLNALTIPCSLGTTGECHTSSVDWNYPDIRESEDSPLGEEGIETDVFVPSLGKNYPVANHLRSTADLLESGKYTYLQGMRENWLDGDLTLSRPLFDMVYRLKEVKTEGEWERISKAMERDWMLHWLRYLEEKGIRTPRTKAAIDRTKIEAEVANNAGSTEYVSFIISAYLCSGRVEDLYPLLVLLTEYSDMITVSQKTMLAESFFHRNLEYCDYLLATHDIDGVRGDDIRRMFIGALCVLGVKGDIR